MLLKLGFLSLKLYLFLSVEVSSASRQAEQLRNHYLVTQIPTPSSLNNLQNLYCGFKAELPIH